MKNSNRRRFLSALVLLGLGACAPRQPVEAPAPVAPRPLPLELLLADLAEFERTPVIDELPDVEPPRPGAEEEELIRDVLDEIDFAAFDMPVHVNDHVLAYIDVFTGRARPRFEQWLARQGQYAELIEQRIRERGLPRELIYLALIESGYSPIAVSSAKAVGLWQFMTATGRLEGLLINEFVDERRDPVRATDAALQHLQRLYDRFGSWYLAAAAYNAGAGRIERALSAGANGRRGSDSLFWQIRSLLPAETRNYVPQLIAASIIGTHRHLFGFDHVVPAAAFSFETATIPDATEFAVIAEAAGIEPGVVAAYNTAFTQGMTPPGRRVEIRLPVGRAERFRTAYAAIPPDQRVRTRVHVVAAGETLSGIARRYGTSVAAIQAANRIARPDRIPIGVRLIVPTGASARLAAATTATSAASSSSNGGSRNGSSSSSSNATAATASAAPAAAAANADVYTVRAGDTLSGIARRHGVSLDQLTTLNGIRANATIRPGQKLRVRSVTVYRVRSGDTLSSIAQRHGVSVRELKEWNSLGSDVIRPGDTLEVR